MTAPKPGAPRDRVHSRIGERVDPAAARALWRLLFTTCERGDQRGGRQLDAVADAELEWPPIAEVPR